MWQKWEAKNAAASASRLSLRNQAEIAKNQKPETDAEQRRKPRQFKDETYAKLLTRSRRNSERMRDANRKSEAYADPDYLSSGGRSTGARSNVTRRNSTTSPGSILKHSPTHSRASSQQRRRVSISEVDDSDSSDESDVREIFASAGRRGRSSSPGPRRDSQYTTTSLRGSTYGTSPTSPAESRALALALRENDDVLSRSGYQGSGNQGHQGHHPDGHNNITQKVDKFTARATTTFKPPRLFTSSRPDERLRSRAATAKVWAKQSLTETVVMHTVGTTSGVKHWDDPTRAAAEQAAVNARDAYISMGGDEVLAEGVARAAARVAAAKAARFVERVGEGAAYVGADQTRRARLKKKFTNRTVLDLASDSEYSDSSAEPEKHGMQLVRESLQEVYAPLGSDDEDMGKQSEKKTGGYKSDGAVGDNAFTEFREELVLLDFEESKAKKSIKAQSEPTSPRGGKRPQSHRKFNSRPNSARHGLQLVRESLADELDWAKHGRGAESYRGGSAKTNQRKPSRRPSRPSSARPASRPTSASLERVPLQIGPQTALPNPSRFLKSGQGGAGMARGRSVAALEEREGDPAHAARLRRQLETTVGPAMAAARAEQAKAAARIGLAKARAKSLAVEAADAEKRSRFARRTAKRDAENRTFKSPLFGGRNYNGPGVDDTHQAGNLASEIKVVDAGEESARKIASAMSGRPRSAMTRSRPQSAHSTFPGFSQPVSQPVFSLTPISSLRPASRFAQSPQSPFSPIHKVYPMAEARRRNAAETEAAFAEAHHIAISQSPRNASYGQTFSGTPGRTPGQSAMKKTPIRPQSAHGKHGLQIVRETLDDELEWARGSSRLC